MKPLKVYIDTSIVGGCEDEEFMEPSLALFGLAVAGSETDYKVIWHAGGSDIDVTAGARWGFF